MLLALWSAYGFESAEPAPEVELLGGGYSYHPQMGRSKKREIEEFIDRYFEELKAEPVQEVLKLPEAKKEAIASQVIRQINAIDLLSGAEIQAAIKAAEIEYMDYLARLREADDEAALMLLLN